MEQKYKYYAFISYNRKDEEWAKWIQYEFEHYHLPSILNGRDDLPKEFRPIFRDIDELSAGNLPKQIYDALFTSRFLIVICSPDAAESMWVNKEIHEFIEIGKLKGIDNIDNIFPFIVDGIPHAKSQKDECFPLILKELDSKDERIGGNVRESGRDMAFVKVLAGTLKISFDLLWNRYEKEKIEEEERKRKERNNLLIIQSRVLAEKAEKWINEGNSLRATLVLLKALPQNINDPEDRPLIAKAELLLREATLNKSIRISGKINNLTPFLKNRTLISKENYSISLWNLDTGEHNSLNLHDDIKYATYSPSGKMIVCMTDYTRTIIILDYESKRILRQKVTDVNTLFDITLEFSSDENLVLIIENKSDFYIYDISNDEIYSPYTIDSRESELYARKIEEFNLNTQENDYYTSISNHKLKLLKKTTNECLICIQDVINESSVAIYSPSDSRIIYTDAFNQLKSFCIANGEIKIYDCRISYPVNTIGVMPESDELFLSSKDGQCNVISSNRFLTLLPYFRLFCYQISPDSKYIAAIIFDGFKTYKIGIWDIPQEADKTIQNNFNVNIFNTTFITESQFGICKITISPDSGKIAALYVNNVIRIFQIHEGKDVELSKAHNDAITDMIFSHCGNYFITASDDCTIKVWDSEKLTHITTINTPTAINFLDCSDNGEYILGTQSSNVKLFSITRQKCIKTFKTGRIWNRAKFSPCNKYIIVHTMYKIKVYEVSSGKCINELGFRKRIDYLSAYDFLDGFDFINSNGDFIMAYEESGIYKGNITKTNIEFIGHLGHLGHHRYFGTIKASKDGKYLLLGNFLLEHSFYDVNDRIVRHNYSDNSLIRNTDSDDFPEAGPIEFYDNHLASYHFTDSCKQNDNISEFRQIGKIVTDDIDYYSLLPIKVSLTNDVLIQFNNREVSIIVNKNTNIVQKVSVLKEDEQFAHISIFQNKYKLLLEDNYISVIDIESQESIGIFYAQHDEIILDTTFSIKGDYIVVLSERPGGKHFLYYRDFPSVQLLIDEVNLRYRHSELTEYERDQCYLTGLFEVSQVPDSAGLKAAAPMTDSPVMSGKYTPICE